MENAQSVIWQIVINVILKKKKPYVINVIKDIILKIISVLIAI